MTNQYPPDTVLRHRALALRDVAELLELDEISGTGDGLTLTYSPDDGFHLFTTGGEMVDITEWVDNVGLVPA